ncbi:hypothetical protein Bca52824_075032 [Brassica carinata]|uniref:Uncharacterized protein n=1 Tax=Brassica carinata TaxID=52824 RepID=A0A8X7PS75_BRACI|nr:hypothetical protein Bca52824_075032 [Brassica carinata]
MDLRPSSGLTSYGSRYVKRIVSPASSLLYTDIAAAPSHQGFYGAKLHWLNLCLQVTAGPIVQECCFARIAHDYVTAASLSHYAVSSIDGSSQSRSSFPNLLVAGTIVQECGLARITNYITAASPSHYAVSNIDGSSQSLLYLLSAICSHMLGLDECNDCMLRSLSVYSARHGSVEFRVVNFDAFAL